MALQYQMSYCRQSTLVLIKETVAEWNDVTQLNATKLSDVNAITNKMGNIMVTAVSQSKI